MATKTFLGGGADTKASTAGNWNAGTLPTGTDTLVFDGTSTTDCDFDGIAGWSGGPVQLNAGFTKIVSLSAGLTCGALTVAAGTLTMNGQTVNETGTCTFSGGTINATSATWTIAAGSFTQTNTPTFNANGGTIHFSGGTAATVTGPNCNFFKVTFSKTNVNFTVPVGTTCPFGTNPSNTLGVGTLTINGVVTWTGTLTLTGQTTAVNIASTATVTISGTPALSLSGNLTISSSATVTTLMAVTFTSGALTGETVTAPGYVFSPCSMPNKFRSLTIPVGTTIPWSNATLQCTSMNVSGAISWNNKLTMTVGTLLFSSGCTVTVTGTPEIDTTGSINWAADATITTLIAVTKRGGALSGETITAPGYDFGTCNVIDQFRSLTIADGTLIPFGNNPTLDGNGGTIVLNGEATWTGNMDLVVGLGFTIGATGVIPGTVSMTFVSSNVGAFTGTSTADCPGLTVIFNHTSTTARTFAGGGITIAAFQRTGNGTGATTITGANTYGYFQDNGLLSAHTVVWPNVTQTFTDRFPFRVKGASGKVVTLTRTGGSGVFTFTATHPDAFIECDYINVSNSTVDAAPPAWYAGPNSTIGAGCTNWLAGLAPRTGELATTLDGVTLAAVAAETFEGALAALLEGATLEAAGELRISGAATPTLEGATLAALGTLTFSGSLEAQLGDVSFAGTGQIVEAPPEPTPTGGGLPKGGSGGGGTDYSHPMRMPFGPKAPAGLDSTILGLHLSEADDF